MVACVCVIWWSPDPVGHVLAVDVFAGCAIAVLSTCVCVCVTVCVHTHTLLFLICVGTIVPSVCTEAAESVQIRAWLERVPEILRLIQRMLVEVRLKSPPPPAKLQQMVCSGSSSQFWGGNTNRCCTALIVSQRRSAQVNSAPTTRNLFSMGVAKGALAKSELDNCCF